MRSVALVVACVAAALAVAGCSNSDKHYFKEGVGANLYSESAVPIADDVASRTQLQQDYVEDICKQAGLYVSQCDIGSTDSKAWGQFVQAGMNDTDQRCDAIWSGSTTCGARSRQIRGYGRGLASASSIPARGKAF
jgi:hypothetical protein